MMAAMENQVEVMAVLLTLRQGEKVKRRRPQRRSSLKDKFLDQKQLLIPSTLQLY
jgi:hypothetical protein